MHRFKPLLFGLSFKWYLLFFLFSKWYIVWKRVVPWKKSGVGTCQWAPVAMFVIEWHFWGIGGIIYALLMHSEKSWFMSYLRTEGVREKSWSILYLRTEGTAKELFMTTHRERKELRKNCLWRPTFKNIWTNPSICSIAHPNSSHFFIFKLLLRKPIWSKA